MSTQDNEEAMCPALFCTETRITSSRIKSAFFFNESAVFLSITD